MIAYTYDKIRENYNIYKNHSGHIKLVCEECGKVFSRSKKDIYTSLKRSKRTLCSLGCVNKDRSRNGLETKPCAQCGKTTTRVKSQRRSRKSDRIFCSQSCAATYNNTHKTCGTRRSKLEKHIEMELTTIYPDIEIHYNRTDAINAELDIYIPKLSLAFELNGVFHYEPIFGQEKLASTQSNDKRKFQACIENNIELCIIDVSQLKYFKAEKARKYLKIVTDIIDMKTNR